MRFAALFATAVFSLALFAPRARAGVLIVSENQSLVEPSNNETSTLYLEKDRMRVETKGPEGEQVLIFRGDRDAFWVIDTAEGTYLEMTGERMRKMQEGIQKHMKAMRALMEERMKNLSPEERKMLEQMGAGPMDMGPPPPPSYKKVASGLKVGRWSCDKYEGRQKGEKIEEVCTADFGDLLLSPEDVQVMEEMQKFVEGLPGSSEPGGPKGFREGQGYPGFPVREVSYSGGRMVEKTEVRDLRRQDFPASLFELPEGLRKMEAPFSQRRGPRMGR